jgi:hypothetical protein
MSDVPPWVELTNAGSAALIRGDEAGAWKYFSAANEAWEHHCNMMYGRAKARNEAREEASIRHHRARDTWGMEY